MIESEARAVLERALGYAVAENTEMVLSGGTEASTRFANNQITQNVAKTNATLLVKSAFGNQVGMVRVNRFDDDSIRGTVRRAEEIARAAAPDSEYMPPPGPSTYAVVQSWDDAVAEATPDERARFVRAGIERADAAGLNSAGSCATDSGFTAVANSKGLFAYHRSTSARCICTAMTPDSSGWAESGGWQLRSLDAASAADRAIGKAVAASPPRPIEPKPYTAILEPAAVSEILGYLAWTMDAKAADEGRSAFSGKLGQRVAPNGVTLASRPDDANCPGSPFFEDGMAAPSVAWIESGVVRNLVCSRFWAQKTGKPFTGRPTNLIMSGGESSVEDMIASTDDGVLITRFWYIRMVDPMKLLLTGMTRDGLFRIEGGKVVGGIRNMRFNQSPLAMLANIVALGKPAFSEGWGNTLVPPIKVDGFTFTSGTEF